jgi:DNA-3-methyladenine glycosylase
MNLLLAPLPRNFYARPVLTVARDCIGKLLVSGIGEDRVVGRIVEAEAYSGPDDRAAHSYNNRRTTRTEVMFGLPGHAYVFMLYGLHYNFNVVTGESGRPQAVLVRAAEPVDGQRLMARRRSKPETSRLLTNGPGKLCQAFGIGPEHYGHDVTGGSLFLAQSPMESAAPRISRSRRIGVEYAGVWAEKPWRFFETGNMWVSPLRKQKS